MQAFSTFLSFFAISLHPINIRFWIISTYQKKKTLSIIEPWDWESGSWNHGLIKYMKKAKIYISRVKVHIPLFFMVEHSQSLSGIRSFYFFCAEWMKKIYLIEESFELQNLSFNLDWGTWSNQQVGWVWVYHFSCGKWKNLMSMWCVDIES